MKISKFFILGLVIACVSQVQAKPTLTLQQQIEKQQAANLAMVEDIVKAQVSHDEENGPARAYNRSEAQARYAAEQKWVDSFKNQLLQDIILSGERAIYNSLNQRLQNVYEEPVAE